MTDIPVLPGITSTFVDTPRLRQHVLTCGPADGTPIVFIHGNFSAATYWEELMLALAGPSTGSGRGFRCIAPDLRGYGWTEDKLIDATRGYRDWSDDLDALLIALGIERCHLVAWSAGGGVAYRFIADHPAKVITVTLQAPVSPYGFGGTKGIEGTPCSMTSRAPAAAWSTLLLWSASGWAIAAQMTPTRRATSSTRSTTRRRSAPRARRTSSPRRSWKRPAATATPAILCRRPTGRTSGRGSGAGQLLVAQVSAQRGGRSAGRRPETARALDSRRQRHDRQRQFHVRHGRPRQVGLCPRLAR